MVIGREFDRQVELIGLILQSFHPLSVLHSHGQIQDGLAALGGGVSGFGE